MKTGFAFSVLAACMLATSALADTVWHDLRKTVFDDAVPIIDGEIVALDVPYRTMNDPRTQIGARIAMPFGEFVRTVTLIIDDNPMPVSAVFEIAEPKPVFAFSGTMRINGPTMVRVVAETDSGKLYMQEAMVKTSGVGACAAPPGTDPVLALETLGTMKFKLIPGAGDSVLTGLKRESHQNRLGRMARLDIDHPSHSGMQMDQISLLFIPARYVETVEVKSDGEPLFRMSGSISFSENPEIRFEVPGDAVDVGVKMTDTEGAVFEENFALSGG